MVGWYTPLFRFGLGAVMLAVTTACGTLISLGTLFAPRALTFPAATSQAVADCPVTQPMAQPPSDASVADFNVGNDDNTLFSILWPDSTVIFKPGGAGEIATDGSLSMKWPWYRHKIKGQVVIEGRRLDASAPPLRSIVGCCYDNNTAAPDCCYGDTGFTPSALIFPSVGCWEVTGKVNDHRLTFVTLVLKLDK